MGIDRPQAPVIISRKLIYYTNMMEYHVIDHINIQINDQNPDFQVILDQNF